jgi:hypothetical protein
MPLATWLCEKTVQSLPLSLDAGHDSVSSWLSHAPSPPLSAACSGKRKRSNIKQNTNDMSTRNSSPSKRRRCEQMGHSSSATEDIENTPRAKSNTAIEPPSPSSFTASSATTRSSHSRRSTSPRKKKPLRKMANLSLLPNPVMMKSIDDVTVTPPSELEDIALQLRRIGRGLGVISRSEKVSAHLRPTCEANGPRMQWLPCPRTDRFARSTWTSSHS